MKKLLPFLILVTLSTSSKAQSRFSAYLGGGMCLYLGDLQSSGFPNLKTLGLSGQAGFTYQFYGHFSASLNYQYAMLKGNDGYSTELARRYRNLGFYSHVHEISLRLNYDILRMDKFKVIPYIFVGIGTFRFNPRAFDGTELQPLGTEGQYIGDNKYPQPYSNWAFSLPLGLGVKYRISCRFSIKGEVTYHKTFTDYIDDVSSSYPTSANPAAFDAAPNGAQALYYSDRRIDPSQAFISRGNPKRDDNFADITLGLIIHFGKCSSGKGGIYEDCKALYKNMGKDKPSNY